MNYLQNHIYCRDSNWGGGYDCQHVVTINSYEDHDVEDWENLFLTETVDVFRSEEYNRMREFDQDTPEERLKRYYTTPVRRLNPEVLEWLEENVKDRPARQAEHSGESPKGWCIPSLETRAMCTTGMSFYFHTRGSAMNFIRRFSKWKKPVHYCQYFTDVRKTLDLETGKYVHS